MVVAIATNRSMAQTQRYYERELMGHEGDAIAGNAEWPTDYAPDREDERRLAVGMKWSAGRAKRKMWRFAERAMEEANVNAEIVEARSGKGKDRVSAYNNDSMLEIAIGDGVKLSSSMAQVKDELDSGSSRKKMRSGEDVVDLLMEDDVEAGRTLVSARSNRSILISDSDDEDVKIIRRQKLKGSFANRRGVARRRA